MVQAHVAFEGGQPTEGGNSLSAIAALAARPFPDLDELIQAALQLMSDLVGIKLSMIHRLEGDQIVVSHVCDRIGLGISPPVTVPRTSTFCDTVLTHLRPLIVLDADVQPWDRLPAKQLIGTKSYIGVPILLNDSTLYGTLCAHDRRQIDLGQREIDTMLVLARIIASQIDREAAMLFEAESARRLARRNAELAEANQQLSSLREITESISAQLDLRTLLETVVASAVRLVGAHAGAISLLGDNLDEPRRLTATFNLPESLQSARLPARAGLMGQVLATRAPVIVERYEEIDSPLPDRVFQDLSPWLAVPVWWRDEILGTFGIGARDPGRRFSDRDVEMVTHLAKHAAVAIENARLYAASRELGAAEERNRLAAEIHDTLAQSLLSLSMQLRAVRGNLESAPDRAIAELMDAEDQARTALEEARRSVWNLGPASLESGSLADALRAEVADSTRRGLPATLTVHQSDMALPPDTRLALLRVAQEAIGNAARHAGASHLAVRLDETESHVTLSIVDDGRGFDPAVVSRRETTAGSGFGLGGMAARIERIGGALTIESSPIGAGTHVIASVPHHPPDVRPSAHPSTEASRDSTAKPIRIVVADDHPATRAGLAGILEEETGFAVIGAAADGEQALALIESLQPDLLLTDLRMPKLNGVELIARLTASGSTTLAIAVTTIAQDELIFQAIRAGARGFLLKDASPEDLIAAVRVVIAGGTVLNPEVARKLSAGFANQERLTQREREIVPLLARGLADKEIAATLGTSVKTANFHVGNVIAKLGAQNRTEAVRIAHDRGLLD